LYTAGHNVAVLSHNALGNAEDIDEHLERAGLWLSAPPASVWVVSVPAMQNMHAPAQ
jgi:hypothetical protein